MVPIYHGPNHGNQIAITFDDGPTPGVTNLILDELKRRNIPSTFFMLGSRVAAAPNLAKRIVADGHEVGNHTFSHPKLDAWDDERVRSEIYRAQSVFQNVLGLRPRWFRPPYGAIRPDQYKLVEYFGLSIAMWSVDSLDWKFPETIIIKGVCDQTKPGSIILFHDLHKTTASCIGETIDRLLKIGFCFNTLSSLLVDSDIPNDLGALNERS